MYQSRGCEHAVQRPTSILHKELTENARLQPSAQVLSHPRTCPKDLVSLRLGDALIDLRRSLEAIVGALGIDVPLILDPDLSLQCRNKRLSAVLPSTIAPRSPVGSTCTRPMRKTDGCVGYTGRSNRPKRAAQ